MTNTKSYKKQIHHLAWPMILSAISFPLLGIVDTTILGHLDSPVYLGAVSIGAAAVNMLMWLFGFLRMATTGLIARSTGEDDTSSTQQHLLRAVYLSLFIGALLVILQPLIKPLMLKLLADTGETVPLAGTYLSIRLWALPASLLILVIVGYLVAVGRVRAVLVLTLISQVGNMVLDYIFVMHLHMYVDGVAWGSLISEYAACMYGAFVMRNVLSDALQKHSLKSVVRNLTALKQLLSINRDIFIRTVCLMYVFGFVTRQSANQGDLVLAANAVLLNFFYLASYGLDGYAHAIESLSGRLYGARRWSDLRRAITDVFQIAFTLSLGVTLIYAVLGTTFIEWMNKLPEVRSLANSYLIWLIINPLLAVASFVYDGICVGMTLSNTMRNSMVYATLFGFIPLWWLLKTLAPDAHINHYLWMAFSVFFVIRGISIHLAFRKRMQQLQAVAA
ncbi:MATE family efflux transporter [Marinicella sp. W31]|uniref:MATE family efflux transporter n=1 Tax=Marinicella sp. W31 TaxID=3023713 RepID=UPI00375658C6